MIGRSARNVVQDRPGVSVVIPAYNYAKFLPLAMKSVLDQTWTNLELIVVDDGSTDNTRELVERESDPRIRYVWQKNAGLPAARNTGIRAARHDFVGFIDADDLWEPTLIEVCMDKLLELPKEFALVACRYLAMDQEGNPIPKRRVGEANREIFAQDILIRSRFGSSSIVVRKSPLIAAGLFDETLTSSEDRDMWIRLSRYGRMFSLGADLSWVRFHPKSMSRNPSRMARNARRVIRKAWEAGIVEKWRVLFWLKTLGFHLYDTAWMNYDARRPGRAILDMLLSILLFPFFRDPGSHYVPPLFRVRALPRFALSLFHSPV